MKKTGSSLSQIERLPNFKEKRVIRPQELGARSIDEMKTDSITVSRNDPSKIH